MQTFLPYPDFAESLRILDSRRLGKQRLKAMQLLRAISAKGSGWSRHPSAAMWRGYTNVLKQYHNLAIDEWEYYTQLLAEVLPPDRVYAIPGGHDYPTFKALWKLFLSGGTLLGNEP